MLTTTAGGLKELMEHAVAATAPGATPGQFPQIGGMAFALDPTKPARTVDATTGLPTFPGQRIRSLVVGEGAETDMVVLDGVVQGDPMRPIRVITLAFLADAGSEQADGGRHHPRHDGKAGNDTYFGGEGRDRMVFVGGGGTDTAGAFALTDDILDFQGAFASAEEFAAAASFRRGATVIEIPHGGTVIVRGRKPGDLMPGVNVSL